MYKVAILSSHNGSGFETLLKAQTMGKLDINIILVISNNTDAKVLQKAKLNNIDTYIVNSSKYTDPDDRIYTLLKKYDIDYVFLSGYMKKLSQTIVKNFKILNSHPSLLPKYGGKGMYGRFVHEAVVANREKESGVTIHIVNEEFDKGKIVLQKKLALSEDETAQTLETKIKQLEKTAIVDGFKQFLELYRY